MAMSKERYDLSFPDNMKDIASSEMWRMARRKLLADLSEPLSGGGDQIHRKWDIRMHDSFDFAIFKLL